MVATPLLRVVPRGGGGLGIRIPMASPRALWHPRARPAFVREVELMSTWDAQPPAPPPGFPAAGGCESGRLGRAIAELAGWHDIDMAPMDLSGACDVQKS